MYQFHMKPQAVEKVSTKYRTIQTAIPSAETIEVIATLEKYESRSMHGQMPVAWGRAQDFQVWDLSGNKWIDFTSTIFVANAGHANPDIKAALQGVLDQDLLHTYTYPSKIRANFLKRLIELTPANFEKAFLVSAGTEATECLIKIIRMHAQKIGKKKPGIVSFEGGYHGRTLGAAMMGGNEKSRQWIGYQDPNLYQIKFPYEWEVTPGTGAAVFESQVKELESQGVNWETDVAGFVLEAYIGWAAAFIPKDYIQALAKFAKSKGILLSFDEIQGGFGRSGKQFVYQHYDVEPDLIACGKGISSSLPLSAVLGSKELMDTPEVGAMSSTHSANPMACAAGLANINYIEKHQLTQRSAELGEKFHNCLTNLQEKSGGFIKRIVGKGLLAAVIFEDPETGNPACELASRICECSLQSGLLLVHTGRESIKMAPPLTIPEDAMLEGLRVFEEITLEEIAKERLQHAG